jgi:hypothetical protein
MAVATPDSTRNPRDATEPDGTAVVTVAELEAAVDLVAAFVARFEPARYSGADAASLLAVFTRVEHLGVAGKTLAAHRAAECNRHVLTGHRSPALWLSAETGDSVGDAKGLLALGETLADQPGLDEAFRAGRLSRARAALVADAVTVNPDQEADLIDGAQRDSHATLRQQCLKAKAEGRSREEESRHHRALHVHRRCRTYTDAEGAFRLDASLTPEAGASLLSALQAHTDRYFRQARRTGLFESPDAYRADALVSLVTGGGTLSSPGTKGSGSSRDPASGPEDPSDHPSDHPAVTSGSGRTGGPGASVHVRVDLEALRRGSVTGGGCCEIPGVGPVSVDVARELLGEALVELVIADATDVTSIYRMGRHIPARLYSALMERDPRCVVPGCTTRLGLENDHWVTDFSKGGLVSLDNIARLCGHHHRLRTHRGFRLEGGPGDWRWVPPENPVVPARARSKRRAKAPPARSTGPPLFDPEE